MNNITNVLLDSSVQKLFRNVVKTSNDIGYALVSTTSVGDYIETMVFRCDEKGNIIDQDYLDFQDYPLDAFCQAEYGHQNMVMKWMYKKYSSTFKNN